MIDQQAIEAFWRVVEDCLVKFHGKKRDLAKSMTQNFRTKIETGEHQSEGTVYHEEPFDISCAIAQLPEADVESLFGQSFSEYTKILTKHQY
jgi:hypothetical protein